MKPLKPKINKPFPKKETDYNWNNGFQAFGKKEQPRFKKEDGQNKGL